MISKKGIDNKKSDSYTRNSIIIFTFSMLASVINYLGQLFMARFLSIESFGTLNAIFSVTPIISVPVTSLTIFITKIVAEESDHIKHSVSLSKLLRNLLGISFLLLVIGMACFPYVSSAMGLRSIYILILSAMMFITGLFPPIYQGTLAGLQKFLGLGLLGLTVPLGRLIGVSLAPFVAGNDVLQQCLILVGVIVGTLIAVFLGYSNIRSSGLRYITKKKSHFYSQTFKLAEYGFIILINAGLMFYMNIDILMIRYFFGGETAGNYSSVQLFARIAYFMSTALVTVMLPMVVKLQTDTKNSFLLLKTTLLYTSVSSIIIYLPLILFPRQIIELLFASKFSVNPVFMLLSCLITFILSLNTIIANYMMGMGKANILAFLLAGSCIIAVILMLVFRSDIYIVLVFLLLTGFMVFLICFFYCVLNYLKQSKKMPKH